MKKTFPGYYCPDQEEFSDLWENCIFILDANVLLNLYRYSKETRDEFIDILNHISDRLWIPHQAALEYQRKRLTVINIQIKAYEDIHESIKKLTTQIRSNSNKNPYINPDIAIKRIQKGLNSLEKYLEDTRQEQPDLLKTDNIKEVISTLFLGKVGPPYSDERLDEIYKIGEKRYKRGIPLGFKDNSKDNIRKYGDLVLWFQLIDKAKETKKPIILITDDSKGDWFDKSNGEIRGPRPELINEVRSKADVMFYLYQADPFVEYANKFLQKEVKQGAINEIREIRKRDEDIFNITSGAAVIQPYLGSFQAAEAAITQSYIDSFQAAGAAIYQPYLDSIQAAGAAIYQPYLDSIQAAEAAIYQSCLDSIQASATKQAASISQSPQSKLNRIVKKDTTLDSFTEEKNEDDEEE